MKISEAIKKTYLLPVYFYRACISPLTPAACRHTPTCSQYCIQAIMEHGIMAGTLLTAFRILRCNPFGTHGYDPVPRKGEAWEYTKSFFRKKKEDDKKEDNQPDTNKE